jgi:hypothetical protein
MKRIPFKYNDQLKQIAREDLFSLSNVLEMIAFLFKTLKILHILLVVICEYCKVFLYVTGTGHEQKAEIRMGLEQTAEVHRTMIDKIQELKKMILFLYVKKFDICYSIKNCKNIWSAEKSNTNVVR